MDCRGLMSRYFAKMWAGIEREKRCAYESDSSDSDVEIPDERLFYKPDR